jgi:NADPH-dependent ferric siderophore reductase
MTDRLSAIRREPPPYRRVSVVRTRPLSPRMVEVTLGGAELSGFAIDRPAASVRLLLPAPGGEDLVMPSWNGNEFLLPDGSRPPIRTFTPRRFDPGTLELDIDVVLHDRGKASDWARRAVPGSPAAVSGPGRGYEIDPGAATYLLAGDETAIPAIAQLLEHLPASADVEVLVEVAGAEAKIDLPRHRGAVIRWLVVPDGGGPGDAMVPAVAGREIDDETRVWVAGEAAAVQRIRKYLFAERGMARSQATIRGYWKSGRDGT